jgi:hypothetical protein
MHHRQDLFFLKILDGVEKTSTSRKFYTSSRRLFSDENLIYHLEDFFPMKILNTIQKTFSKDDLSFVKILDTIREEVFSDENLKHHPEDFSLMKILNLSGRLHPDEN